MPSLGADMESGTLLEWYVKPGDAVKRGDIVAVVDTSKAEIEVEIFEDGVIGELLVAGGHARAGRHRAGDGAAGRRQRGAACARAGRRLGVAPAPRRTSPRRHRQRPPAAIRDAMPPPPARLAARAPGGRRSSASTSVSCVRQRARTARSRGPTSSARRRAPLPRRRACHRPRRQPRRHGPPRRRRPDRQAAMREAIGALMARSKREIPHYYLRDCRST